MTRPDVVTLGETMVSLRSATPLRLGGSLLMTVAGSESNVAIGLARLGHSVRWGGRVGADEAGAFVLRTLRAESVNVDTVVVVADRQTGLMLPNAGSPTSRGSTTTAPTPPGSTLGPRDDRGRSSGDERASCMSPA
jgi:2-dehydro-3-deoxygluconokinase